MSVYYDTKYVSNEITKYVSNETSKNDPIAAQIIVNNLCRFSPIFRLMPAKYFVDIPTVKLREIDKCFKCCNVCSSFLGDREFHRNTYDDYTIGFSGERFDPTENHKVTFEISMVLPKDHVESFEFNIACHVYIPSVEGDSLREMGEAIVKLIKDNFFEKIISDFKFTCEGENCEVSGVVDTRGTNLVIDGKLYKYPFYTSDCIFAAAITMVDVILTISDYAEYWLSTAGNPFSRIEPKASDLPDENKIFINADENKHSQNINECSIREIEVLKNNCTHSFDNLMKAINALIKQDGSNEKK